MPAPPRLRRRIQPLPPPIHLRQVIHPHLRQPHLWQLPRCPPPLHASPRPHHLIPVRVLVWVGLCERRRQPHDRPLLRLHQRHLHVRLCQLGKIGRAHV